MKYKYRVEWANIGPILGVDWTTGSKDKTKTLFLVLDFSKFSESQVGVTDPLERSRGPFRMFPKKMDPVWPAVGSVAVSLADDITPGHLSAQEHLEQDDVEANNDSKPVSKRRRQLMKHRVDVAADDVIRSDVNTYLLVKVDDDVDDDPCKFWKNAQQLVTLNQLTAVVLTRSASFVDVECMFSTISMGLILNGKRSRLSAQSADALSFIHDNFFLMK